MGKKKVLQKPECSALNIFILLYNLSNRNHLTCLWGVVNVLLSGLVSIKIQMRSRKKSTKNVHALSEDRYMYGIG